MVWGPGTCETSTCWRTWWQRADHPWVEHLLKAWTAGWQKLLKFRKKSQHSECTICAESRLKLHDKNLSSEERIAEAAKWRRHLVDQYHDRLLYWSLRYASRHMMNILVPKPAPQKFSIKLRQLVSSKPENSQVLTIDSLDKGKMAYPAWRFGKVPSSLDLLRRPRLVSWPCRLAILN